MFILRVTCVVLLLQCYSIDANDNSVDVQPILGYLSNYLHEDLNDRVDVGNQYTSTLYTLIYNSSVDFQTVLANEQETVQKEIDTDGIPEECKAAARASLKALTTQAQDQFASNDEALRVKSESIRSSILQMYSSFVTEIAALQNLKNNCLNDGNTFTCISTGINKYYVNGEQIKVDSLKILEKAEKSVEAVQVFAHDASKALDEQIQGGGKQIIDDLYKCAHKITFVKKY